MQTAFDHAPRHPPAPTSDLARWHALVTEAEAELHCCLGLEQSAYLIDLLRHRQKQLWRRLDPAAGPSPELEDLGDLMLLWAGLVPERVHLVGLSLPGLIEHGRAAYGLLAAEGRGAVYAGLARDFVHLVDLLYAMREIDTGRPALTLLEAWELEQTTGSRYAARLLARAAPGASPGPEASRHHH
jgi:hypothetical protein